MNNLVCHVCGIYLKISENWVHTQIKHLNEWNSVVLARYKQNLEGIGQNPEIFARREDIPIGISEIDAAMGMLLGWNPSYYYMAHKYAPDVFHAHFGPKGCRVLPIAGSLGIPIVTTFYGYDVSKLPSKSDEWLEKYEKLFNKGNMFLAEGPFLAEQLIDIGCPPEKIKVQRLGIELDRYPYIPRKRSEGEPLRVLMAGRFDRKKGFVDGLKAFAEFVRKGGEGEVTIVGGSDGSEQSNKVRKKLYHIAKSYDIKDITNFKGFIPLDELKSEYYNHHMLLSPSHTVKETGENEGGAPVILLEAQATGLPVVATKHCDIPFVVDDESTGFLAKERQVNELVESLFSLYENEKLRHEMGVNASKKMAKQHDAVEKGSDLESVYECLI
ncbi:colanic acid/amylovoran biosynthesis glycosyltransferase [Salinibacter ruber]|uniref:glycosyltransferase n=1 Tax=Salinibacter ruber TaxID=146919 RepID=UPI002168138B|nr:glycosyltransferase [Salinibacter ruber]MCS3855301.1 colanic acid/amylovoran biosynthesis glycosyltransferase [Salinibacter ruber]